MNAQVLITTSGRRWAIFACLCGLCLAVAWFGRARRPMAAAKVEGKGTIASKRAARLPELEVQKIVQHGHIVEIKAKVEPGATVMVNGERAAVIWGEGEIRHFVGPLPDGMNEIAITVQNNDGGFKSQKVAVTLP